MAALAASVGLIAPGCALPTADLMARGGLLDIQGDIELTSLGGTPQGSTSVENLGLGEEGSFQPRIDVNWRSLHLTVNGFQVDYSGSGAVTEPLQLDSLPAINVGELVRSSMDFQFLAGDVYWDPLPIPLVDVGIGVGVARLDYNIDIQSQSSPGEVFADGETGFGYLGLRGATEIGPLGVILLAKGFSYSFENEDINFVEVDGTASFRIFGGGSRLQGHIFAGYRYLYLDYEFETLSTDFRLKDFTLSGPYLGFDLRI
jgi:hypothetical protein